MLLKIEPDYEDNAGNVLVNLMDITDSKNLNKVVGKAVRVTVEGQKIKSIGHIINNQWRTIKEKEFSVEKAFTRNRSVLMNLGKERTIYDI